jgi:predicted ribosomally synthesized peptide with nif11-like leader
MKTASDFLHKLQNDSVFIKSAKSCNSDEDRRSLLVKEGFTFSSEELDAAVKCLSFFDQAKKAKHNGNARKNKRYDVFLDISELDGKPINQAVMVDISSWGAKIESQIPLKPDSSVEFTISLTGEKGLRQEYRLSGKVLWASQAPISKRNQAGLRFDNSLDQLQDQGKFPLDKLQTTVNSRHRDIAEKEFLSVREFADMVGVHWFTVWRWTVERRIQFKQVKTGCKILIPKSELSQFQSA